MNRNLLRKILFFIYAFIVGAIFGWGFAFLIIVPLFQLLMAIITGSDRGALWTNYFIYISCTASIIGGIYISERWCSGYLEKKEKQEAEISKRKEINTDC